MEFLVILATLITASLSQPTVKTWTLNELSRAIEKQTDVNMQPYLEDALNQIMYALYTGNNQDVYAIIPSPTGDKVWTMDQLKKAVDSPITNPTYQPFMVRALHQLDNMNADGNHQETVEVTVPALDISVWTTSDVEEARDGPSIPALLPYLKKAEVLIQKALKEGKKKENIRVTLVTPVGIVPVKSGTAAELIPRNWAVRAVVSTTTMSPMTSDHIIM